MIKLLKRLFGLDGRTGTDIVDEVLEQFTAMTTDLNTGINLLDDTIEVNQAHVERIKAENAELGAKKVQAILFRRGLENLLSGTVV